MTIRRCLTAALLILGTGCFAAPSNAQAPGQHPSHVPIPGGDGPIDYESIFQRRLRDLEARQDITRLFPPEHLKELVEQLKKSNIQPNDPRLKDFIQQRIGRLGPDGKPMSLSPEEIETLKQLVEGVLKTGKPPELPPMPDLGKTTPPVVPDSTRPNAPTPTNPADSAPPLDPAAQAEARDQIMQWARRLEGMARDMRDSPTLQQAFRDMSQALLDMQSNMLPSGQRLDTQLAELNQMTRNSRDWFQESFKSLGRFELPNMPRFDLPSMKPPDFPSVPNVTLPRGLSRLPSTPDGWKTILLVAGTVILVLLGGKLLGRLIAVQRASLRNGWKLGPWPMDPSTVATRADVVRAFEYLSLLRLGQPAETWNHREIADRLAGETAERRALVAELADFYEQARYTPADEPMPAESIAQARRDLCLLAGVSAA